MRKNKQRIIYSPTVYGLYSNVAKRFNFPDWLTPSAGGETWHVEGGKDKLVNKGGQPSTITKKDLKDQRDNYFSPILGVGERWKSSMNNGTNPVRGLLRTVVPAVGTAAALYYSPTIVSNASKIIPKVAKTVAAHPKLSAQIGKRIATKTGVDLLTGIAGGNAVNNLTNIFTNNKDWGEFAAPYLGVSKDLADWTNPGYVIGPAIAKKAINSTIDRTLSYKNKLNYFNEELQKNKTEYKNLTDQLKNNDILTKEAHDKSWEQNEKIFRLQQIVGDQSPILQNRRKIIYQNNRKKYNIAKSDDFPINNSLFQLHIPKNTSLGIQNLDELNSNKSFPLVFTNQNRKEFKSYLNLFPKISSESPFSQDYYLNLTLNDGKFSVQPGSTLPIRSTQSFGHIFKNNTPEVQKGISEYVDNLNNLMGDDGAVAGSLIHYKNGIFPATENGVNFIGPADTEIYTTQNRLPNLMSKLQFKESTLNSVGGHKGISPHTFRGDSSHNGIDTEINVIDQDQRGNATGKLAHQIYRALYPEKYSELMYDHALSPVTEGSFSETSLPISAEDLFQTVNRNPQSMQQHLLTDMVGMETFTNPNHIKASKRLFSTLFNDNGNTPELLGNALRAHGKYNLGSNFKQSTELYPNMQLNDINSNIEFLKNAYKLTDEEATQFASNPQIMSNAINLYDFQNSVGVRLTGRDVVTDVADNGQQWHNPKIELFTGNGSFGGGNTSGDGLNRALLNPAGGWHFNKERGSKPMDLISVTQAPLTLYPEKIKTPLDIFNQINRLKTTERQLDMEAPYLVSNFDKSKPLEYDNKTIQYVQDLAKQKDIPVNFNMGAYDYGYSGSYVPPISAGARRSSYNDAHELGSLLKDIEHSNDIKYIPATNSKFVQDNLNVVPNNFENMKNTWKNYSLQERLNNGTYTDDNLEATIQYPNTSINTEYNDAYKDKLSELKQNFGLNTKEYFEGINDYIKNYRNTKQQLNDAVHELSPINRELKLLRRQHWRLNNQLEQCKLNHYDVVGNIKDLNYINTNDKNSFKASGILSGVGLGFLQWINYIRNKRHDSTIQYNNKVADEKWGYSNPRHGNYGTYQYFDYLDQGYPEEAAGKFSQQDEQKAQELYEQNNPTHKSYQQGGTLAS